MVSGWAVDHSVPEVRVMQGLRSPPMLSAQGALTVDRVVRSKEYCQLAPCARITEPEGDAAGLTPPEVWPGLVGVALGARVGPGRVGLVAVAVNFALAPVIIVNAGGR